jgi:nicotinate-nucleotide adenylyltransferase
MSVVANLRAPLAPPGARIGLLGGSFDPAHAAHRLISETARRKLGLDAVWWLVSPGNPLKTHRPSASLEQRVDHSRRVANARWIIPTGLEADLGTVYSADTIAALVRRFPQSHFVWLMGADNLAQFHRWRRWRDIQRMVPIAVIDRPGQHFYALASPAARAAARHRLPEADARRLPMTSAPAWVFLTGPLSPLSSTALRAAPAAPSSGPRAAGLPS